MADADPVVGDVEDWPVVPVAVSWWSDDNVIIILDG